MIFDLRTKLSLAALAFWLGLLGCSITATRPVQEMSDTAAAIRAAREVQADSIAPELYRQANDWFFKAKNEYKLKNFKEARDYALRARHYAEQAEFESVRSGGNREDVSEPEPQVPAPHYSPYDYPTPTGTPADLYDQQQQNKAPAAPAPSPTQ